MVPSKPSTTLAEYDRYVSQCLAVEHPFLTRAKAAIIREFPDAFLLFSNDDDTFIGYSNSYKTLIKGILLRYPRWNPASGHQKLEIVMADGQALHQLVEIRRSATPSDEYWDSYYIKGFAFTRVGAERVVEGRLYLNDVLIVESNHNNQLNPDIFRTILADTIRTKFNLDHIEKAVIEFQASYLVLSSREHAGYRQRVEMPGLDFSGTVYLDEVAENFIDACEPLFSLIDQIGNRFWTDNVELCNRYLASDEDWESLGFV